MSILAILVAGILAGAIASYLMRGTGLGIIVNLLVGLAGSFIGGFFFGNHLSVTSSEFVNVLITAIVGAIILLFVIGLFARPAYSHRRA
jgi:uncharacterized membrane protein YeaQ/YmgE (transglycosylase-associated protein family)